MPRAGLCPARAIPTGSGGPYAYTRQAYGDLAGFLVAWGYWISTWTTNAALAVAFVGYLDPFIPSIVRTPIAAASLAVGTVWLLTAVNCRGTLGAGRVQLVTTALKILPLAADRNRRHAGIRAVPLLVLRRHWWRRQEA